VDAAAKKVADDFFRNFNEKVAARSASESGNAGHGGDGGHDAHGDHAREAQPVPRDPDLPTVSGTTLSFFAAGGLVIYLVSLFTLF
jgi:hypothetical protein